MSRSGNRAPEEFRELTFTRHYTSQPAGSVLVSCGNTRILCTVSIQENVPPWLKGQNQGWVTAEYGMLPASTNSRKPRDGRTGRVDGRSQEIQRLIGRCLRTIVDMRKLPEVTLWADCDVISADGGTRTAAINGACVAMHDALSTLELADWPMRHLVSAISVGVVKNEVLVDLDYSEDHAAAVDMNVACVSDGRFVEVQGTAERAPFSHEQFQEMLSRASDACRRIHELQQEALEFGS
ncbi:MAG: ribonuclease PH [Planctomycetes bacterium]|nr:ribonuclease PH [Planctomycetota bacterium]